MGFEFDRTNFVLNDVEEILKILVSYRAYGDNWIWLPFECSIFTVKNCYNLLLSEKMECLRLGEVPDNEKSMWKRVWKLPIINKIKHFFWRVLKGIIRRRAPQHFSA